MKFRGKIFDICNIHNLTKIIATISKLTKNCKLRLTAQKLYLIFLEHTVTGGIGVWCEMSQENLFNEYLMEGVNLETANEIYLSVNVENFLKCLKCSQNAKSLKIKLTRKGSPCLTFEVEQPTLSGTSRKVMHDSAVELIERKFWGDFAEPLLPQFGVSIYMPPLKIVKNVIERMKNLSNHVIVGANHEGEMVFKIEKDLVNVSTHFENLTYPGLKTQPRKPLSCNSKEVVEVKVDVKKLAQLLSGQQINPTKVICNITPDEMLHLILINEDMSLQYFIPSVVC
ncbi:hypothetical protein HELRODRAFT_186499 [Helobdella robusta]|uniref:Checkpoint protein n=1 Tax=Helobdella robusta TaxID=6412 RepID=T1FP02_HELRO|nr:hypothetical protein HELRODRAFT_186499 [Helobdella robusta]ESN99016.1 hypothetical protein HELRODRAFT_186499 [Helobdella robusta]